MKKTELVNFLQNSPKEKPSIDKRIVRNRLKTAIDKIQMDLDKLKVIVDQEDNWK
jgi:hypothetical protein